jgi:hypothetical protein
MAELMNEKFEIRLLFARKIKGKKQDIDLERD